MAVWDAVAETEDKPLFQLLLTATATASRTARSSSTRPAVTTAGQDHRSSRTRCLIDRGYTVVKKIGGASLDEDLRRIDSI
jgi:L-alanine-DL-glutamate epimerase-like enolase superfamily enzyme